MASDSQHARWGEFVVRYRPMMEAYLRERFPSVDADDIIQETLIAVCSVLPSYRYAPDEKGHFRSYLTGILRNRALRQLGVNRRQAEIAEKVREEVSSDDGARSPVSPERSEPRKRCAPPSTSFTGRAGAPRTPPDVMADDEQSWRKALVEIALRELMNDASIQSRNRQVFLRVAVNGDKPEDVAAAFGIKRNAVDQIKHQVMLRLRKLVSELEKAGNI